MGNPRKFGMCVGLRALGLIASGLLAGAAPAPGRSHEQAAERLWRERVAYETLPPEVQRIVDGKIRRTVVGKSPTKQADRQAYWLEQRVPAGVDYPVEQVREAARKAERQAALLRERALLRGDVKAEDFVDTWRNLGPGNVGGRTRAMVIHPLGPGSTDPDDPGFMLAAGVAGGIFRSDDGGASWRPVADLLENIAVSALAMDPENPQIVYAGTGEGFFNGDAVQGLGMYKSTNGGLSWQQMEETLFPFVASFAFQYVNKIAISPADPKRIYVATRTGVWRHDNRGEPTDGEGNNYIWRLMLANPIYLFGQQNARGSIEGALDVQVRPAPRTGNPDEPEEEIVLASFGGARDDGLWLSVDGGDRWFRQVDQTGASDDTIHRIDTVVQGRMTVAFGPRTSEADEGVVYVLMARNGDFFDVPAESQGLEYGGVINVFRADMTSLVKMTNMDGVVTDAQLVFEPRLEFDHPTNLLHEVLLSNPLFSGVCAGVIDQNLSQGWYDNIIKVDPADEDIVWVGGIDLFRSDDGAANFGVASYWYFDPGAAQYVHADQHEIVFHPQYDGVANQTMYVSNDGGLHRTLNARAPVAEDGCPFLPGADQSQVVWKDLNNGYEVTQFYHGDSGTTTAPNGRDMFAGGTQDNGVVRSFRRSCTESWDTLLTGDGGYTWIDPTDNNTIYGSTQNFGSVYRMRFNPAAPVGSEDPENINNGLGPDFGLFITPIAMDPNNPNVLWTGGLRPWRTTNANDADPALVDWDLAGPNFNFPGLPPQFDLISRVSAIAVAPSDSDVVYMGTEDGWVLRTLNGLANDPADIVWEVLYVGLPLESGYVSSIAVDPYDPDVVWLTNARFTSTGSFGHVFRGSTVTEGSAAGEYQFIVYDGVDCNPDDGIDPVLPDVPAHWVTLRKCNSGPCDDPGECLVIVGTEIGVFISADAWAEDLLCDPDGPDNGSDPEDRVNWTFVNIPMTGPGTLPRTVVESIDLRDKNTMVAFTHGRGAFLAELTARCGSTGIGIPCNAADLVVPFETFDLADFNGFIADFQAGRLSADMPLEGVIGCGDGVLDASDLIRFVELFSGAECAE